MQKNKQILFINACVRENSRTLELAKHLLSHLEGELREYNLETLGLRPLTRESLARREALLAAGDRSDPMLRPALDFAAADTVVLAAPYWDLSFPASVKTWIEHINCVGLSFAYGPDDRPYGLCRARRLYYVMTAGGPIMPANSGYAQIRELCACFYGIPETVLFAAQGLDLRGADVEEIMAEASNRIDSWFRDQKI
ncbi:MAG: NAD(P)H-dependent oxidoreductase [Oscillospiraceae bacterium]|nr:NAD(P)H-dependent oxidoreductase [Oscillospiraceae bacterium]